MIIYIEDLNLREACYVLSQTVRNTQDKTRRDKLMRAAGKAAAYDTDLPMLHESNIYASMQFSAKMLRTERRIFDKTCSVQNREMQDARSMVFGGAYYFFQNTGMSDWSL
ncbi:hypothetical protein BH10ACI2_BH10ACI2_12420 [soil metagenome]